MKKRIISYICATVIILSSCYISVKAQVEKSYTSDGGYFTVDGYDQTVYVDTNGTRYSYYLNKETNSVSLEYRGGTEDVVVPESVNGVTVTSIGGNEGKKKLKSMSMPDTITEITSFYECEKLESIKLSNNITFIGYKMFCKCSSLKSVEIPPSVIKIDEMAFWECPLLSNVKFNEGLTSINMGAFDGSNIKSLKLPSTLITIGDNAFSDCTGLEAATIPAGVQTIGKGAFKNSGLRSVKFEGTPNKIGSYAFSAQELSDVVGLSDDTIMEFWTSFRSSPWQESFTNNDDPFMVDKTGKLVAYVGSDTSVNIPDTVKEIGDMAFMGKAITNVTIPNTVTKINDMAFYGCSELTSVIIPARVTKIGKYAFQSCTKLKDVVFEYNTQMLNIGESAFLATAITEASLVTNNRLYTNKTKAFDFYDDISTVTIIPKATEQPKETATPISPEVSPTPTEAASATPAATAAPETLKVTNGDEISLSVNDKKVNFTDAQPFIDENERTQIPVRNVAEALDCKVLWDDETKTVTITKNGTTIIIKIGSSAMQCGKSIVTMDTTAQIINDRTYIPLRFAAEALGMTVEWSAVQQ